MTERGSLTWLRYCGRQSKLILGTLALLCVTAVGFVANALAQQSQKSAAISIKPAQNFATTNPYSAFVGQNVTQAETASSVATEATAPIATTETITAGSLAATIPAVNVPAVSVPAMVPAVKAPAAKGDEGVVAGYRNAWVNAPQAASARPAYAVGVRSRSRSSPETARLVAELRHTPQEHRDDAKVGKLRELLLEEFEAKHEAHVKRLQQILAEAKRTEEILSQREDQKSEIVERHMTELLGGKDPLNWDYQPGLMRQPGASRFPQLYYSQPPGWNHLPKAASPQPTNDQPTVFGYFEKTPTPVVPGSPPAAPKSPNSASSPAAANEWTHPPSNEFFEALRSKSEKKSAEELAVIREQYAERALAKGLPLSRTREDESGEDFIVLGHRILDLSEELQSKQRLQDRGLISKSQLSLSDHMLKSARAQWAFRKKDLAKEIQIGEVELASAMRQLETIRQELDEIKDTNAVERRAVARELLEAEKDIEIARIQLKRLVDRLAWCEDMEDSFESVISNAADEADDEGSLDAKDLEGDSKDSQAGR